jgi:hypothetical protein
MLNLTFLRIHPFRCPDEQELAAYVDQQLIGAEREHIESHLAKCDSCLQQVGFLIRGAQDAAPPLPAPLLARAKQLQTAAHRSAPITWQWAGAAAAIAVVAISAALWRETRGDNSGQRASLVATAQQQQAPGIADNLKPEDESSVRGGSSGASLPVVLSPAPGATVNLSDFIIRWQPSTSAVVYEVRVVTADGSVVWHQRVREAWVRPPARILRPGRKYFVWVRALLRDGGTQVSPAVSFIGG